MSTYVDVNTPVISQITLPSGNTYYIADREIRNVVQDLSETVAGGVSFNIAWTEDDYESSTAPSASTLAGIPAGVTVYYDSGASTATGTLAASSTTKAIFYLIYSRTQTSESEKDYFDEYVTITIDSSADEYAWEKIGDTIVDLDNIVQSVSYNNTYNSGTLSPDSNGDVDITNAVNTLIADYLYYNDSANQLYIVYSESESAYIISESTSSSAEGLTSTDLWGYLMLERPLYLLQSVTSGTYTYYRRYAVFRYRVGSPIYAAGTSEAVWILASVDLNSGYIYEMSFGARTSAATLKASAVDSYNLVSAVTLNQDTANVIGTDATFTVTDPTISVTVTPTTTYLGATASGASTAWNSKDSVTALTSATATTTNIKATATGTAVSASGDNVTALTGLGTASTDSVWGSSSTIAASGDSVTVVTGYASPTTDTFVKSVSAETGKNLVTTTVTGVQSSTTTASKATASTSQTTASGSGTSSSTNTDWLKGVSVSNEVLTIGAATLDTQTTTQFTFADVTVPIKDTSTTTVATGSTSTSGTGDAVVTGVTVGSSATALTGLGTASTDTVLGTSSTFSVSGDNVTAVTGYSSPTTDTVLGTGSSFTVTQPTVALATGATAGTGVIEVATGLSTSTDTVIGTDATFTVTQPTITLASNASTATGRVQVATGITSATGTASGTAVAWDDQDAVTALTDSTTITVTNVAGD